jgi:hypothetical protein
MQPPPALKLLFACAIAVVIAAVRPHAPALFSASETRASFALRYGEISSRLRVATTSLLPGEKLLLAGLDRERARLELEISGGPGLRRLRSGVWSLRAPREPGLYELVARSPVAPDEIRLNVFVLEPRERAARGELNGYAIGSYPESEPVRGFVEVTAENAELRVSPRFRLRQLLCKQPGDFPKYVMLDDRLLPKLEALLDELADARISARGLEIMSGYRTPRYNSDIGNPTRASRHLFGAAADVFVDEAPRDGVMDDLDGDGEISLRDAELLFALADRLDRSPREDWSVGGASAYPATDAHGPFLHLDVRGHAARW